MSFKKKTVLFSLVDVWFKETVKPKCIQTPSFLTLSQFIRYSLENGDKTT